ncbi:glycosyltransferase family 2 protein [Flavobacterium haoranii]|uniref:Glycosyltransferase, GT2 family n=1 Tax=Flavobacterium haoranii TaxID=683124 RepID=A0A1M6KB85_9FLAO|nr:glycosyltransferase family 2 protein [Flavobacterium haoranii]SHJ56193.1 Glycosyltransferase, GT2 family [Flavobacterium haoranii]
MQLSVIILNYNVRYFLEQCVYSVQKALQGIDGEIIVVDNASSDDSCQMIKEKFSNVTLIENKDNLGFPKGNNIGVAKAKGEYICILNPDTVVAEDTFSKILDFVNRLRQAQSDKRQSKVELVETDFGIIGCKLIDGSGKFLPECKRGVPTPWVAFTKIFGLYKLFPKSSWFNRYYAMHLTEYQSGEVDILVGAFMFMQRDLYLKVGGFDENCFMYSDDIDLSYLVKKAGYSNQYFADTTVIHYKGESTVRDGLYMKRFREAMQFFYKKHFKKSWFFDVMMQMGSFAFSLVKRNQQKNIKPNIDKFFVFSDKKIKLKTDKSVEYLTDLNQFQVEENKHVEIIFDIDFLDFKEVIFFMDKYKDRNISFKNYISKSNYLIGSYNSNDKGEVLQLESDLL